MKNGTWITLGIFAAIALVAYFALTQPTPQIPEEVAICIGQNSLIYVQLGCSHCEDQEAMFGSYVKHLNSIDCFYENDKCGDVEGTPTWVINNESYVGVQSIARLQELTGC